VPTNAGGCVVKDTVASWAAPTLVLPETRRVVADSYCG